MTVLLLVLAVAALGTAAGLAYHKYRRTREDQYRLLALLLWYGEVKALIALDRANDPRLTFLSAQLRAGARPQWVN